MTSLIPSEMETAIKPDALALADNHVLQRVRSRRPYTALKRMIDLCIIVLVAPSVATMIAVAAVAILVTMGRPVFFAQERVGKDGRVFRIWKLRSMTNGNGPAARTSATTLDDARVTPFGRILRASHIDELPQLWNITLGQMTLIGPRPEQPNLVSLYQAAIPGYEWRHAVKPGLSGWSQVKYGYAANLEETRRKFAYDFDYLTKYGPLIDFKIAVLTCLVYLDQKYVR